MLVFLVMYWLSTWSTTFLNLVREVHTCVRCVKGPRDAGGVEMRDEARAAEADEGQLKPRGVLEKLYNAAPVVVNSGFSAEYYSLGKTHHVRFTFPSTSVHKRGA